MRLKKVVERPGITWHPSGHPTCLYFEEKIGQERDPQIWDLGSGMAQKWSKMIQMPKICMKSSCLTNYYPHFIDFDMPRHIWTTIAKLAKICKNGRSALIRPKAKVTNL